jgi:hypothetical protein
VCVSQTTLYETRGPSSDLMRITSVCVIPGTIREAVVIGYGGSHLYLAAVEFTFARPREKPALKWSFLLSALSAKVVA